MLLLTALTLLDRLYDLDCCDLEGFDIDDELKVLRQMMSPADDAYFQATLDIIDFVRTI